MTLDSWLLTLDSWLLTRCVRAAPWNVTQILFVQLHYCGNDVGAPCLNVTPHTICAPLCFWKWCPSSLVKCDSTIYLCSSVFSGNSFKAAQCNMTPHHICAARLLWKWCKNNPYDYSYCLCSSVFYGNSNRADHRNVNTLPFKLPGRTLCHRWN